MSDNSSQLSNESSLLREAISNRLLDLHTQMPGIIDSFNANTQTARVQPAIRRIFRTDEGDRVFLTPKNLPLLIDVPVIYPRGGGFSLTFPVKPGDECLLCFCERSIDSWFNSGSVSTPTERRFHSLSDAVALMGLSSQPNAIKDYNQDGVELRSDSGDNVVRMSENGAIRLENESGYVELTESGEFDINGIIFSQHIHPQQVDSDGNAQVPTEPPQ